MRTHLWACAALFGLLGWAPAASSGDLVYTPVNPSFGGSPLNSAHLLGLASAQRTATAGKDKSGLGTGGGSNPGTTPGSSDSELFVRQLQGRLLSALASQVTNAIFPADGSEGQNHGKVTFGDTVIEFTRTLDSIRLVIDDATGITVIEVPQLVKLN